MKVRRRVLTSAKRERLDGPVRGCHHSIYHPWLEEAFRLKIVHEVVCVIRGCVTFHASRLAKEQLLPARLGRSRFLGIQLSVNTELRSGREIQDFFELRHCMYLTAAVQNIHALLFGDDWVAIEIGG